jgi:integrase
VNKIYQKTETEKKMKNDNSIDKNITEKTVTEKTETTAQAPAAASSPEPSDRASELRFAVHTFTGTYVGERVERHFIVLKQDDVIVGWTDYHKYILHHGGARRVTSSNKGSVTCITKFLNYVFFDKYHVASLKEVTNEMVVDYLQDYGLCRLPGDSIRTHRAKGTVDRTAAEVLHFLEGVKAAYPDCEFDISKLFKKKKYFNKQRSRYETKEVPAFQLYYAGAKTMSLLRDMPDGAFKIIFNEVLEEDRNILMLVALQAFAGLRPSEACNVRREDSKLGAGLMFDIVDGEVMDVYIDLQREYVLRSDLKPVGGIKKERMQKVYPAFLNAFMKCYDLYMSYIAGRKYEKAYGPLTINNQGKAMTYANYADRFRSVVRKSVPKMLESPDFEVVHYALLLRDRDISPHILRHWFSVRVTLYGANIAELQYWRGDSSPESSIPYIQNKSELEKSYEKVASKIFDFTSWLAEKEVH